MRSRTIDLFRATDVQSAFETTEESEAVEFSITERACLKPLPVIHDREIVVENAFALPEAPRGFRFVAGIDL